MPAAVLRDWGSLSWLTWVNCGSRLEKDKAEEALRTVHAREAEAERKVAAASARAEAAQEEMERLRYSLAGTRL